MKKACGQGCLSALLLQYCSLPPAQVHHQDCAPQFPSGVPSCPLLSSGTGWTGRFTSHWTSLSGASPLSEGIITCYLLLTTIYYLLLNCTGSVFGWRVEDRHLFSGWGGPGQSQTPKGFVGLTPCIWQHFGHYCEQPNWEIKMLQESSLQHIVDHWLPAFLA